MTSKPHSDTAVASLRESSERMAEAAPVFIVGHPRSGTSLLYRTLQHHPSFRPHTIDLQETQLFARIATGFRFDTHAPPQLRRFMLRDDAHFQAFLDETRTIRRAAAPLAPLALATRGDLPLPLWRAARLHLVVRSYLAHAWAARGAERLLEKSPRNTHHLDKIRLVSPNSRCLYLIRHPLDVYSSYLKRAQVDPSSRSWADLSVRRFCRIYADAVRRAQRAEGRDEGMLVVRYESFTASPEPELRRICDHLGEPFVPEALETRADEVVEQRGDAHLHAGITEHTKDWADYLSIDQARQVESALAATIASLGYESGIG